MTIEYCKAIRLKECLSVALELISTSFRYGEDGESSVALVDSCQNLVAFIDNGTSKCQYIRYEGVWDGDYITELEGEFGSPLKVKAKIKKRKKTILDTRIVFANVRKTYDDSGKNKGIEEK